LTKREAGNLTRYLALFAFAALALAPLCASAQYYPPAGPQPQVQQPLNPEASPAPEENRKGLDGVWEVQLQHSDGKTTYNHFKLTQNGNLLTGSFLDNEHNNKKYPVAGSVDGHNIRLVVTRDNGSTMIFTGTVDGMTDMIGMLQDGPESIAFTAAYRPKYRFLDTITPVPGGIGGGTGTPPGGTGMPP
jgi:hypothetical protein